MASNALAKVFASMPSPDVDDVPDDDVEDAVALVSVVSEDVAQEDDPLGEGLPGGGPPGGGPALATACSSPLASSDAESAPSPFVSRLEKAALSALVEEDPVVEDVLDVPVDDALAVESLVSPRADSISDRLSEPFDPNWLIRSFARLVAASSRPEVEAVVESALEDVESPVAELS